MVWTNKEFRLLMIYILTGIHLIISIKNPVECCMYQSALGDAKLFNANQKSNHEPSDLIET